MSKRAHTGSRLRERRILLALKQADLARDVGISPAYLNLIEHNKRRIGGKLLLDLARALGVDPGLLIEGAEAALLAGLRDAAASLGGAGGAIAAPKDGAALAPQTALNAAPEVERIDDLAARYPGWSALIAAQHGRIAALERTVEALTDRLTHDPFLSASLHEVLSSVTSIRSTAGILANGEAVDPEWQARFHRNIYEDSRRLAESSQALVAYLDAAPEAQEGLSAPQDEVEAWLTDAGFHMPALEGADEAKVSEAMIDAATQLRSAPARQLARGWLTRYSRDAARMPLAQMQAALQELGPDPALLAARFGVSLAAAMRRLGALPIDPGAGARCGVVICDGSGTITFRQPLEGFALPRFGAACPLWPLYRALANPGTPVRAQVAQSGPNARQYITYAICQTRGRPSFDAPPILEATMLILPAQKLSDDSLGIGSSCRICAREACAARREPSIMADGL
ncbi:MAG: short-chain fatty acyl-CoA regulator family protein [Paracoccaceae bacterium]